MPEFSRRLVAREGVNFLHVAHEGVLPGSVQVEKSQAPRLGVAVDMMIPGDAGSTTGRVDNIGPDKQL